MATKTLEMASFRPKSSTMQAGQLYIAAALYARFMQ